MSRRKAQAPKQLSRALQARLHRVRLLAMDVDGVLTDAGMRIKLLQAAGLVTAFVTKEETAIVERRGQKLEVPEVHRAAKVRCPDIILPSTGVARMGAEGGARRRSPANP